MLSTVGLGDNFMKETLKLTDEEISSFDLDVLDHLGLPKIKLKKLANLSVYKAEAHTSKMNTLPFLTANRCGKKGQRFILYQAHLNIGCCPAFYQRCHIKDSEYAARCYG